MLRSPGDDASLVLPVASFDGEAFASSWKTQIGKLALKKKIYCKVELLLHFLYVCVCACACECAQSLYLSVRTQ